MNKKFWNFINKQESATAELYLYGDIAQSTWWGDEVTPKEFVTDLLSCEGKPLTVRINSGGGDVFAAATMYNLLKTHKGGVTVRIDGLCASAATVVACAGDKVIMPSNAIYMIHDPAATMVGSYKAEELNKMSNALEIVKKSIKSVYESRCGSALIDEVEQLMTAETYLTADDALRLGLVDEIESATALETVVNNGVMFVNKAPLAAKNLTKAQEFIAKKGETMEEKGNLLESIKAMLGISDAKPEPVDNAAELERERITALDALKTGNTIVDSLVDAAKKNGTSVEETKQFVDAVKAPAEKQAEDAKAVESIRQLIKDQMQSNAGKVDPSKNGTPKTDEQIKNEAQQQKEDEKADTVARLVAFANKEVK